MNALSTLGSYFQPQAFAPRSSHGGQYGASAQPTAQDRNEVALSDAGRAMAPQGSSLLRRVSDLGSATVEAAKKFVANFAASLFGDAAKGMSISFEQSSISASSSFSSIVQHAEGSNGSSDAAALLFEEASDFVGKGTITTADGHSFSFEVEVHYESTLAMAASSTSTTQASGAGNAGEGAVQSRNGSPGHHRHNSGATREGLSAHFPGSVAELFEMLDQGSLGLSFQGQEKGDGDAGSRLGNLKLHLLNLITNPDAIGQKLAKAYGDLPAAGKVADQV
jgi:hypothetical protein